MRLLPKQNSATQRSLEIDRPLILESPDQLKTAKRRKLASRRDKRVWEGLKHQRPVTSVSYASTLSRLSRIGHSASGAHPSHAFVSFCNVFFIDSRLRILESMSAILALVRVRIAALVVLRETRRDNSSRISASENPSS